MLGIREYLSNPRAFCASLLMHYGSWIPDRPYLKYVYYLMMGKHLDLQNPYSFNEKLQWLKLYNRRPEYTVMVDKYAVKDYAKRIVGEKCIIPTLGVWDRPEDVDFDNLPNQFVLKPTNSGGGDVLICKDKSRLDLDTVKKWLRGSLKSKMYEVYREWPYKDVKPRIIAEAYMCDDSQHDELTDYKFFCFNGYADCVMICVDRQVKDTKFYFFDREWDLLPLNVRGKNTDSSFKLPRPACMDEMFEIAGKLSEGIPFLRVDLYCSNGKPYFGETTFFPASGFDRNLLDEAEEYFGKRVDLTIVKHH